MKRLENKLLSMEKNTTTYKEMYEGSMIVVDPAHPTMEPEVDYSPVYYSGRVGFEITATHKLAQDKPTVVISIPCRALGIDVPDRDVRVAAADLCLRSFGEYIDEMNGELYNRIRPDKENGKYYILSPGGEVIPRNSAYFKICPQKDYENGSGSKIYLITDGSASPPVMCLCIRIQVQLPAKNIRKTIRMLCRDLPKAVDRFISDFNAARLRESMELARKQSLIRNWLGENGYCAFIANGSILPRLPGTDLPLPGAVPFTSAPDDEIEICGVRGMGIKKGVTIITGGGYSGKSTLLDAISAGVYDHVLGDGRELCITDDTAVAISSEDGRGVKHVNISPFIKWLPGGNTRDFSTEHASGSTSQAANIAEAIDSGAGLLLIDEDRSATNFMIRDRMMKQLIEKEPITPFTDRVNELYTVRGVSTILVIGGSGEYLSVADKVYLMEDYLIRDVTDKSRDICRSFGIRAELPDPADWSQSRTLYSDRFSSYPEGSGTEKLEVSDLGFIIIGDERIDVRGLHNVVSPAQLDALGFMLRHLEVSSSDRRIDLEKRIDEMYAKFEEEGLDCVYSSFFTTCRRFLDLPRRQEFVFLINRMRNINLVKGGDA